MQFITLSQLARDLDFTEKKTRRILHRLIKAGKFDKGVKHYDKDDFRDETHFTYLIDPVAFIREAHLEENSRQVLKNRNEMV